ncbi:toprim domain-containing protein [Bartonella sp. CB178]|uniref:toprim domain-containing protein n=1 Tax=Bartonella sp. CB178 TaxID=3112255 RepID=UPI00300E2446
MSAIFEIKQKLSSQASSVAEMLLPQGHRRGNDWIVGSTRGEAGKSLSVCLSGDKAGLWYDFAEGNGGDILDLWCCVKKINLAQALEEARHYLNLTRPKPFMAPKRSYRRPFLPAGGTPQNLVKTYLNKERCIPLDILKRYRIRESGGKIIFPFYKPDGTLALVKERLAQAGAKSKPTTAHCEAILFGWQAIFPVEHALASTNQHASPTVNRYASPTVNQHTSPTANQHASPTANQHTSPTVDRHASPTANQHTSPTANQHASPTANRYASPTANQHASPTANQHASPTANQHASPTANQHASPTANQHASPTANQHTSPTVNRYASPTANQHASPTANQHTSPANRETVRVSPIDHRSSPQVASSEDKKTGPEDQKDHPSNQGGSPDDKDRASMNRCFVPTNRTIVVTEGEIDALSLAAYGYPAVSVPFGGGAGGKQNWIENDFDHLEAFETIFLATDMDKAGEEAADEIANRLGRHRCYRVCLPRKDANECLTSGVDAAIIANAFSSAKSFAPKGLRRASDYKDRVIELFWPEHEQPIGYTVPYPRLKDKLYFRPAELTLWSGSSGAGKSQLLSDCIPHWIAQKSRLCLASLEMKGEQSLRRLTRQTGGLNQPKREMIEQILHFLDDGLILYEHVGKSSVDTLLDVFDYCRARYGCDQFIIDSLMRLGIASDDYAKQEQAVYKMVDWAVLNSVHIHLVAHARKSGIEKDVPNTEDIKGASEIGANAFNIITIWRNRSLEDKIRATSVAKEKMDLAKRPGVIMNIAKQRSGDFEGKIGLWFDQQTYRYRCSYEYSAHARRYLEHTN